MNKTSINALLSVALLYSPALAGEAPSKDREAIKAMAGEYEVQFEYDETIAMTSGYELKKPYHPKAKEIVFIVEDTGNRISLQHLLIAGEENRVIKHWKQLWTYEDTEITDFKGDNLWVTNSISPDEAKGAWSQRVYQVDDSPRYEVFGKWTHDNGNSIWTSNASRRPLPRREHTTREDYEVMITGHRITITPEGWVHEQDNLKRVTPDGKNICLEDGVNYYNRTDSVDFSEAIAYWKGTAPFWKIVSDRFDKALETRKLKIRNDKEVNGSALYKQIFRLARETAKDEDAKSLEEATADLDEVLAKFIVPATETASN